MKLFPIFCVAIGLLGFVAAWAVWQPWFYDLEKPKITDEFVERVAAEIYVERHKREPEIYPWATWQDFLADPKGKERLPVWLSDIRLGIEVIDRVRSEP